MNNEWAGLVIGIWLNNEELKKEKGKRLREKLTYLELIDDGSLRGSAFSSLKNISGLVESVSENSFNECHFMFRMHFDF